MRDSMTVNQECIKFCTAKKHDQEDLNCNNYDNH